MRELPANVPATDAALFERLREMFGLGDYDEGNADEQPYWKFRAREVAKVKASRKKWDVAIPELYVAALFCKAHGKTIRAVSWLPRHIADAWRWWDANNAKPAREFEDLYAQAIRREAENPDATWLNRLLRAAPAYREEVYKQWISQVDIPFTPHA